MLIGIDDTDSLEGMCTTHIAALLCRKLDVAGFPRLIRLNPNIPWKTRGNGAVSLKVGGDSGKAKEIVLDFVGRHACFDDPRTNPGVVFIEDADFEEKLKRFYKRAVSELVRIDEAIDVAREVDAEVYNFGERDKNGRGVIGALGAVGGFFSLEDRTYELLAYRVPGNYGKKRKINLDSVFQMNSKTYPGTFNSVDLETKQILITPHGKSNDPVFCGVRGETPDVVADAWGMIKPLEEIALTQVFETNQGTDDHLVEKRISDVKPYDCVIVRGSITERPKIIEGGHVIFRLSDGGGSIDCAAYEPTGKFRDTVRELFIGDEIRVCGGVSKYPGTLNMEKIQVLDLQRKFKKGNPVCKKCGTRMTSAGKNKGFKCKKCGSKAGETAKIMEEISRNIEVGFYEVPSRAMRHLSKPLVRMLKRGEG